MDIVSFNTSGYAFYNKALVLIELGLHRHNFGDMAAALEYLDMAAALDINPDDKDALHMKVLLTQVFSKHTLDAESYEEAYMCSTCKRQDTFPFRHP